jgi:hypothetical protein
MVPLPDTARNIQYALFREGLQAEFDLVRFEAPVEDCCATANKIVAEQNAEAWDEHCRVPGLRPMASADQDPDQPRVDTPPAGLPAPWFDPQSIRNGLVAGRTSSHTPAIWIDVERGIFYYQYHD